MNFTLTINGDTPAELLAALQQLNTPPLQPPQSEPATQPDKPKAQTPANQKKATQKPAAAPAEEPANPTMAEASDSPSQADAASATSTSAPKSAPVSDPATLDKIRDLARSLIVHGKRAEVQQIIKGTGAASISKLPSDSYADVWEQLVNLSKEVDNNAAG